MCKLCSLVYWRGLQGVVWCRVVACVRLSVACFVTDTFRCRKENKEKWHKWHRNRIESRWFRVISLLERYRKHRWTDVAFTELKWILFCLKLSHYFRPCAIFCRLSAFWEKIVSSFRSHVLCRSYPFEGLQDLMPLSLPFLLFPFLWMFSIFVFFLLLGEDECAGIEFFLLIVLFPFQLSHFL